MEANNFNVGEECLVRVRVSDIDGDNVEFETIGQHGEVLLEASFRLLEDELDAVVKVDEPKYDPCRLFREGDIVRPVEKEGRTYFDAPPLGEKCLVIEGESETGIVCVEYRYAEVEKPAIHEIPFYYLELVTPVEELEPYSVGESTDYFSVDDREGEELSIYWKDKHPNAKAAAEAECKRLNDEWQTKVCRSEDGKEDRNE